MNRRKRRIGIALLLLIVLIGPPVWITYREYRQARLDHALIAAIKAGDDKKALQALVEGASGEARDTGEPPTFRTALLHLCARFRHPGLKKDEEAHAPALLLLFGHAYQGALFAPRWPDPNMTLIRALLDHGAGINEKIDWHLIVHLNIGSGNILFHNCSPLWFAIHYSHLDTTRLLLERGADPNLPDEKGDTPLMQADDVSKAELLLQHGANIEAVDKDGLTALIWAVWSDNLDKVHILLEHGAKVSPKTILGRDALDYTVDNASTASSKIAALLRKYGAR